MKHCKLSVREKLSNEITTLCIDTIQHSGNLSIPYLMRKLKYSHEACKKIKSMFTRELFFEQSKRKAFKFLKQILVKQVKITKIGIQMSKIVDWHEEMIIIRPELESVKVHYFCGNKNFCLTLSYTEAMEMSKALMQCTKRAYH